MSRRTTEKLAELERENIQLRDQLIDVERAAMACMTAVGQAADEAVENMRHDLEIALGHLAEHQPYAEAVYNEIVDERIRQDQKHGVQRDLPDWVCHLFTMEEVGEVSKALLELEVKLNLDGSDPVEEEEAKRALYTEIIQAAACFVKWAQNIRLRNQEVVDILEVVRGGKGQGEAAAVQPRVPQEQPA